MRTCRPAKAGGTARASPQPGPGWPASTHRPMEPGLAAPSSPWASLQKHDKGLPATREKLLFGFSAANLPASPTTQSSCGGDAHSLPAISAWTPVPPLSCGHSARLPAITVPGGCPTSRPLTLTHTFAQAPPRLATLLYFRMNNKYGIWTLMTDWAKSTFCIPSLPFWSWPSTWDTHQTWKRYVHQAWAHIRGACWVNYLPALHRRTKWSSAKADGVPPRERTGHGKHPLPTAQYNSTHGYLQMENTEIRLIMFFAAKEGEALYSQQKQDQELTVAQIMNSLLPNSDLNWGK